MQRLYPCCVWLTLFTELYVEKETMDFIDLEQDLRSYRPQGLTDLPANFVWPRYEGISVANLAATITQTLGDHLPGAMPPLYSELLGSLLDGVERVILIVVDALGWEQLQRVLKAHPETIFSRLAQQGRLLPITTAFLSTTTSVLNTIWTGRPSLQHGLLAFELYLREWAMAVEAISFSTVNAPFVGLLANWGFDAENFIPVPTLSQALKDGGIATYSVTARPLVGTPLSQMQHRGVKEILGYGFASEFWWLLGQVLREHRGERFVLSGYWSGVDSLAHHYGPLDRTGELEICSIAQLLEMGFLQGLATADRKGTLFLLTADHGQITTPSRAAVLMQDHPQLRDALFMPPLGESRVPFFYVRPGQYTFVWNYLHKHLGKHFTFFSRQAMIESGLLGTGTPHPELVYRLGDIIGIARDDAYFVRDPALLSRLRGRHGGLDAAEMLVPLLAVRLDA